MRVANYFAVFVLCNFVLLAATINQEGYKSTIDLLGSTATLNLNTQLANVKGKVLCRAAPGGSSCLVLNNGGVLMSNGNAYYMAGLPNGFNSHVMGTWTASPAGYQTNAGGIVDLSSTGTVVTANQTFAFYDADGTARLCGVGDLYKNVDVSSTSTIEIGLKSFLSSDILLGDYSTLKLIGTLKIKPSMQIRSRTGSSAPCRVNLNGNQLWLGGTNKTAGSNGYNFVYSPGDIVLSENTTTYGPWIFGCAGTFYLRGNGHVLDLSKCTVIPLQFSAANTTLIMEDVYLVLPAGQIFSDATGGLQVQFANNVTLDFTGGVKMTNGNNSSMTFTGKQNKLLLHSYKFHISTGWTLALANNVTVDYDTEQLGSSGEVIVSGTGVLANGTGASWRARQSCTSASNNTVLPATIDSDTTLTRDYNLSAGMRIANGNQNVAKNVALDGGNHIFDFTLTGSAAFVIDKNVNVTLKNMRIKNFDPTVISHADSNCALTLDNVILEIDSNVTMPSSMSLNFVSSSQIHGNGKQLLLNSANQITNSGGSTLTIKSTQIYFTQSSALTNATSSDTIQFTNSDLWITNAMRNIIFAQGNLIFDGNVNVYGLPISYVTQTTTDTQALLALCGAQTIATDAYKFVVVDGDESDVALNNGGALSALKIDSDTGNGYKYLVSGSTLSSQTQYPNIWANRLRFDHVGFVPLGTNYIFWVENLLYSFYRNKTSSGIFNNAMLGFMSPANNSLQNPKVYCIPGSQAAIVQPNTVSLMSTTTSSTDPRLPTMSNGQFSGGGIDETFWWIQNNKVFKMPCGFGKEIQNIATPNGLTLHNIFAYGTTNKNTVLVIATNQNNALYISQNNGAFVYSGFNNVAWASVSSTGIVSIKLTSNQSIYWHPDLHNLSVFNPTNAFIFSSTGTATVKSCANLTINSAAGVSYVINPANDNGITYNTKRHWIMEDDSATITLNGGSLFSSATALALDRGKLVVERKGAIYASAATGNEMEISHKVDVQIKSNATLDVARGVIKYV